MTDTDAGRAARRLSDHPWLERLARVGYAGSGLVHLVIGWIALQVALGAAVLVLVLVTTRTVTISLAFAAFGAAGIVALDFVLL